ncbi:type IIL restriction-modification enzyme MmeI [Bradyrhizobium erythrophlei]|uniref:site-specific DNA-methyltransferase (adenine-specific) n=1 Tax=Bradyrhizobium erythrophlei TaxID=1437360 RepID=A0A1M5YLP0_9BRAD|nr:hypothetical protein SAMN05443248_8470 [Bradyrhizobium erythrophlei]
MGEAKNTEAVEAFIRRWQGREGGQERANYVSFLNELIALLGLPPPDPADATHEHNDYVFERAVRKHRDEGDSQGRIDLYKKNSFVLEAKQSRLKGSKKIPGQNDLFTAEIPEDSRGRRGADRAWDVLMLNAKRQAEEYARALPTSHGWPPFILICDVGHCIEVYADFSGQGKNYTQFPDRQTFRIYLEDLRNEDVRDRLRKIWLDPASLDPAQQSAKVTRDIAKRLAQVSLALEKKNYPAQDVAMFLMRCLFTMFAEDVGLLPEKSFKEVLEECEKNPDAFTHDVGQLWEAMDLGTWAHVLKTKVKKFNGEFFRNRAALPLGREEIGELRQAASYTWKEVDPSIFGTLLEQALDPEERDRLGAHYTPRAYVERLVVATVIEPLREDWRNVQATAETKRASGDLKGAAAEVRVFHEKLCETRVLDPACGTGNFLYVSLELMKRLEGEVLEALLDLGGQEALRGLGSHSVDPHQFLGLEINPRAAAIAELVLWIGYLQWHFRTKGAAPEEPILRAFRNIQVKNAVLTWDSDLTIGVDVTAAKALEANEGVSSPGVKLHGAGFIVSRLEAEHLGLGKRPGLEKHLREYRHGRDLTSRPRGVLVIDLFGLREDEVRRQFPEVYQHVKLEVKEKIAINSKGEQEFIGRDWNNRESYKEKWWIFGEPREELRPALFRPSPAGLIGSDLPVGLPSRKPVQPPLKKYSGFPKTQITLYLSPSRPERGALAIVTNVGAGCGGRGSVRRDT